MYDYAVHTDCIDYKRMLDFYYLSIEFVFLSIMILFNQILSNLIRLFSIKLSTMTMTQRELKTKPRIQSS